MDPLVVKHEQRESSVQFLLVVLRYPVQHRVSSLSARRWWTPEAARLGRPVQNTVCLAYPLILVSVVCLHMYIVQLEAPKAHRYSIVSHGKIKAVWGVGLLHALWTRSTETAMVVYRQAPARGGCGNG
jgi:hypothetical protein